MNTIMMIALFTLISEGKTSKEMTEEMILKKTEKNRKRRQAAQRRKEKRKVRTLYSHGQCVLVVGDYRQIQCGNC